MSQSKCVRSKRKILIPNEITVSLKTPKSRQLLFRDETTPSYPKESEFEDGTAHIKKCKRKKIRKTQNFLDFVDETNCEVYTRVSDSLKKRKIALSAESIDTGSSEVFLGSEERPKTTTKCRKKKMKLPAVIIDDFECLYDNEDSEEILSNRKKKHRSIESISSSTSEVMNVENSGKKVKRRIRSKKSSPEYNEEETISLKTRSSRKTQKHETFDKSIKVAIVNKNKSAKHETTPENISSRISDSELNVQNGVSAENSEADEGIISARHFSSVGEDDEINAQGSGRKMRRKKKSKLSNQKYDKPETIVLKTRSSRQEQKYKEIGDDNEGNQNRRGSQTSDSEFNDVTVKLRENTEYHEVDGKIVVSSQGFSSFDLDEAERSSETHKKKKKRSKKSNRTSNGDETITPSIRSSRKRQKYKEIDDTNEENLRIESNGPKGESSENINEEDIFTKKIYSSVDEEDETKTETSRRRRKRSKKLDKDKEDVETLTLKSRNSRWQKYKEVNTGSIDQIGDSEDNIKANVNDISIDKYYSAVDEHDEMQAKTTRRSRKESRKSRRGNERSEKITLETRSSKGLKDKEINDKSEEVLLTDDGANHQIGDLEENIGADENVIFIEKYNSSVDEDDEIQAETSRRGRKRSKKLDQTKEEDKTITLKTRSSKGRKAKEIEEKSQEILKINGSNDLSGDFQEKIEINEDVITNKHHSSFEEVYAINADTIGRKRSKSSNPKYHEEKSISPNTRISGKVQKNENYKKNIEIDNTDSEKTVNKSKGENFNISRESKKNTNQPGGSGGNTEDSEIDEGIFTNLVFSSADDNDASGRKRKRSKNSDLECEVERMKTTKTRLSVTSPEADILPKPFEMENDDKENVKFEDEQMVERLSTSRKSRRVLSIGSTNQIGEAERSNETNEEIACTDKRFGLNDRDQFSIDTNGVTSEPAFLGRQSSRARKRWTIVVDKQDLLPNLELDTEAKKEMMNASLSVNLNTRRSVRKRWSTELRKKFESMKEEIEPVIATSGVLQNTSVLKEGHIENRSSTSSLNTSMESPISTKNVLYVDSPMPFNVCAEYNSIDEKQNETYSPEKSKNQTQDFTFRRSSKRLSRSLDLSEGILPLEQTFKLEDASAKFHSDDLESSSNRKSQTPGSILKRRGTYDLDISVTDVSVLRSLSESNLSDTGLLSKQDGSENVKKNVRFQHVTMRKGCGRKNDHRTPVNESGSNGSQVFSVQNEKKTAPKLAAANKSVSFDQTMFSASSLASSTPLHLLRKNILVKQASRTENLSMVSSNRRSRSVETKRDKYVSRIRMPNFTKIHQKAMDRVEDIKEMTKRKAERARLLLSGQRPTNSKNTAQEKHTYQTSQPKQLKFAKCQLSTHPANSGTSSSHKTNIDSSKSNTNNVRNRPDGANKNTNPIKNIETVSSNLVVSKTALPDKLRNIKTNPIQTDGVRRVEQIKTIATKSKPQTDTREERRTILKGVRGNRRFELLMKMRKK